MNSNYRTGGLVPGHTVAVGVRLDEDELAMIRQYAKDMGYPSTSSALRRIIQEWAQFKQAQLPLPQTQCQ